MGSVRGPGAGGRRRRPCGGPGLATVLLTLMLSASTAAAQTAADAAAADLVAGEPVDVQVAVGFAELFRIGRWTPLTVSLDNRGDDLIGQLDVDVGGGDAFRDTLYSITYRRRIELPRGSQKRFHYTVFLSGPSTPLTVRVSAGRLVLVLSRDADLDYLNDGDGDGLRVRYPHPERLPERWQGYDGVDALIIHGVSLERLSERQFEALQRWLAAGGICAVSGGPDYALLRTPRLAELLPAAPLGTVAVAAGAELSGGADGLPSAIPQPFTVHRLDRFQGRVLYRAGERPLIIERRRGRGRVLYLTFDIARAPFDHWAGMPALWSASLRLPPPPSAPPTRTESPVPHAIRAQPKGFPEHGAMGVFVALYLGILASGYRLAAAGTGRRALPWLVWSTPLLFAPAGYWLFGPVFFPYGTTVVALTTLEPIADSRYGRLHVDIGVYATRRSDLRVDYAGAEPVLLPVRRTPPTATARPPLPVSPRTDDWLLYDGERRALQPSDRRAYVLHLLQGYDLVADETSGAVERRRAGLRLRLRTDPGRPLYDAWLIVDRRGYALGSLAAGTEFVRDFDADADAYGLRDIGRREVSSDAVRDAIDRHAARAMLRRALDAARTQQAREPDTALLLGLAPSPLRPAAGPGGRQRIIAAALVRAPLPLTPAADAASGHAPD